MLSLINFYGNWTLKRRAETELFKGRHFEHEIIICVSAGICGSS
jgi:hypothetical protein